MGGLFVVAALVASLLLFGDLHNGYVPPALVVAVGLTAVGVVDDLVKIRTAAKGIGVRSKFVAQLLVAGVAAVLLYQQQAAVPGGLSMRLPLAGASFSLGLWFVPLAIVVIVGASNAVNLTDGLDGLAGGCLVAAMVAMTGLVYAAGHAEWAAYLGVPRIPHAGEMTVLGCRNDRRRPRIPLVQLPSGPSVPRQHRRAAVGRAARFSGSRRTPGTAAGRSSPASSWSRPLASSFRWATTSGAAVACCDAPRFTTISNSSAGRKTKSSFASGSPRHYARCWARPRSNWERGKHRSILSPKSPRTFPPAKPYPAIRCFKNCGWRGGMGERKGTEEVVGENHARWIAFCRQPPPSPSPRGRSTSSRHTPCAVIIMKNNIAHIVFSGGGTGGHLFPGLAVAEQLSAMIPRVRITFCGGGKPFERQAATDAGFEYFALPSRPLPHAAREAVSFVVENLAGYLAARRFLREEHVSAVVGLGGYVSVPMARAASRRDVPLVLLEQNAVPGRATRWLARRATLICTTFAETAAGLRCRCPVRVTGNPIRFGFDRDTQVTLSTIPARQEQERGETGETGRRGRLAS